MEGMDADQIARLAWLGLLAAALLGWFFMQLRGNAGRTLQHLAVWALIFVGVVAGYGLWQDIRGDIAPMQGVMADGRVEIPLRRDGHYHATVTVNGVAVEFIVDTGASDIVLSAADAARVGIDPAGLRYLGQAQTANGTVSTAMVTLESVTLGPVTDIGVRAVVNGGEMGTSLLGMTYLHRFSRIEIAEGRLILTR